MGKFLHSRKDEKELLRWFYVNRYFWRTYNKKEIDYIEERDGKLSAYEFKYADSKHGIPKDFIDNYGVVDFKVIDRRGYADFLL